MSYFDQKIKALQEEREKLALWAQVFKTPLGRKAMDELARRRDVARNLYQYIPATHPDALTMLVEAQHAEKFHAQLIQSVEDAASREKDIDKEIEGMVESENKSQRLRREAIVYTGEENDS